MKKLFFLAFALLTIGFTSCETPEPEPTPQNTTDEITEKTAIETALNGTTWVAVEQRCPDGVTNMREIVYEPEFTETDEFGYCEIKCVEDGKFFIKEKCFHPTANKIILNNKSEGAIYTWEYDEETKKMNIKSYGEERGSLKFKMLEIDGELHFLLEYQTKLTGEFRCWWKERSNLNNTYTLFKKR